VLAMMMTAVTTTMMMSVWVVHFDTNSKDFVD